MSRSRRIVPVQAGNRVGLGNMARYPYYEMQISADGRVITLTGKVIEDPLRPAPPQKRTPKKRVGGTPEVEEG